VVKGLSLLLRSTVERIQQGEFMEFMEFLVFDSSQKQWEWKEEHHSRDSKQAGSPVREIKRRGPRGVPDISLWGTHFTLFERVKVETEHR